MKQFDVAAFACCFALDLSKNFPITQEQMDNASDGEVINFHLILKKDFYPNDSFKKRDDILFVHANNLKQVSKNLFRDCSNI